MNQSPPLMFFFMMKCVYFAVSALQLRQGYVSGPRGRFLLRSTHKLREWTLLVWRVIPFAFEVTTILNYVADKTSLNMKNYMKAAQLHEEIHLVKCTRQRERETGRKFGEAQKRIDKCLDGVLPFVGLLVVLWLPPLLLSAGNPDVVPNVLDTIEVSMSLQGFPPFYTTSSSAQIEPVTSRQYQVLAQQAPTYFLPSDLDDAQRIKLDRVCFFVCVDGVIVFFFAFFFLSFFICCCWITCGCFVVCICCVLLNCVLPSLDCVRFFFFFFFLGT